MPIELIAPAKVNLALEVTGRRPDGYHELVSVAQTIDLADRVVLDLATTIELEVAGEKLLGVPLEGPRNLAYRAAVALAAIADVVLDEGVVVAGHLHAAALEHVDSREKVDCFAVPRDGDAAAINARGQSRRATVAAQRIIALVAWFFGFLRSFKTRKRIGWRRATRGRCRGNKGDVRTDVSASGDAD